MKSKLLYLYQEQRIKTISDMFLIVGLIWSIIEMTSFFVLKVKELFENNICIFIIILICSLLISIIKNLPKSKLEIEFPHLNSSISIKMGDLFNNTGNIIIGSSNFFDTTTSKTNSIKTQLINRFYNNKISVLDTQIEESLKKQKIKGETIDRLIKIEGKLIKYNIGVTVDVDLPKEGSKLFITAINSIEYNEGKKIRTSNYHSLQKALNNCWNSVRSDNNNKNIFLPILGAGVTGLSISKATLCKIIINSFLINNKEQKIGKSLNIIIPEINYTPKMFKDLEIYLKNINI